MVFINALCGKMAQLMGNAAEEYLIVFEHTR
jgi:hypothetical protein